MLAELSSLIPSDFSDSSRVWIYQSSRAFIEKEVTEINEQLEQFYTQWQSHGTPVKGWAKLLYNQFVVIIADETATGVSGCSTDSSVRIIKSIEKQYEVKMFDRMMLTFLVKGKAEMLPVNQVQYAVDKGFITKDTMLFNNIVDNKEALMTNWLIPLEKSWLGSRVKFEVIS